MTMQIDPKLTSATGMPEGEELRRLVVKRHRRGAIWLSTFQISLILAILVLLALIYNIVSQSFGLIAVENELDPDQLVAQYAENQMVSALNTTATEDDNALADQIAADPNAIGFFGYAFYQQHADTLRTVAINGVEPNETTANDGTYALARPLFLYTAESVLAGKPEVGAFLDFYLRTVNSQIAEVGYFPVTQKIVDQQLAALAAVGAVTTPVADGEIEIAGSSTVYPLTLRMAELFKESGFRGTINVASTGTKAGYAALCLDQNADIANVSRAIARQETAACAKVKRAPVALRIGSDAIAVVVNRQNDFLTDASPAQLQQIFTTAERWSDVDSSWPDAPIVRYIPSLESGTLDFFVDEVFADLQAADLSKEALIDQLKSTVSAGVMRRFEREKPLADRSQPEIYELVVERVIQPTIIDSWNLLPSLFQRTEIEAELFRTNPDATTEFHSWVNGHFLRSSQSSTPGLAGVRTAFLGSLWVLLITLLFAVPVGIGAAVYLEEYAVHGRLNRILQTNIDNLAGVPSIIYGILGLAIFVRFLERFTSGAAFGVGDSTTANGRTILSAGLTLGMLILPIIIINAQEAIRAVPMSLREAGYGMGGTKWQVIRSHVLANALPGILTGTILAISRAVGETAPLIVIGASTFITVDPNGPFSKFTVLPMQIYQWTTRPQLEFQHIAAAASIVLLLLLFSFNATAIYLRNRFSKQL